MTLRLLPLIAAAGLALPMPVAAQSATDDVRCLLASNVFAAGGNDAAHKQLAATIGLFFLGRVDARLTQDQLRAEVLTQGKALTGKNVGDVMNGCVQRFQAKQRAMVLLGQQIAKSQPHPAAPSPAAPLKK
jgi:hypothetical protein